MQFQLTSDFIKSIEQLIANKDNKGFSTANNQAIEKACGEYILLLNPDTVILDDVLREAIAFAEAQPDVGVVGCRVGMPASRDGAPAWR